MELELKNKEWKEFDLKSIFPKIQRGKRLKKADHQKGKVPYISSTASLLFLLLLAGSCSHDDNMFDEKRAYIVGFDPCTLNHNYKIGYVIITEDLKDTLITYRLSDGAFNMPASIFLNPNDTLYKIPESYFENYRNSIYFPDSLRYC